MRRKRVLRSRKSRALRWLAALCLLLAVCHVTDIYCLTLGRSLERQDQYWLGGRTELEAVIRDPYCQEGGIGVVTASWNDRVLALGLSRWTPLRGWVPGLSWPEERTGGPVDTAAAYYSWDAEGARFPYTVYGIVNDPAVTAVRVIYREYDLENETLGPEQTLPVEIQTSGDGRRYFLATFVVSRSCEIAYAVEMGGTEIRVDPPGAMSLMYDWPNL